MYSFAGYFIKRLNEGFKLVMDVFLKNHYKGSWNLVKTLYNRLAFRSL